ncbi:MAG: cardiolipin synthase ClsB [Rhodocyclaceae bacterium]|nr:cardiolipin synthase ClsB [Rhodocyclaceae bacterium]MCA3082727.1 cardiolipin synthase ClsB [Rhodocyclaceae bacterium]
MKIYTGNRITLLKNGAAFFPAMLAAIDAAVDDIRIEIYIFEDDVSGRAIAEALARAAQRGVAVRLLIDGFGSLKAPETFFDAMRAAGVDVLVYRPLRGKWFPTRHRMRRTHRKIVLVDGKVGFLGGINFIDDFTENLSTTHPRYDYAVKVEGPVLAPVYESVHRLWRRTKWLTQLRREHDGALPTVASEAVGDTLLAFVSRDNVKHRRNIEQAYRAAISAAKSEVLIASSYFLPGRPLRQALVAATQRGVKVEILLQGAADHPLMQMATRSLYADLLEAGIVIHEYRPAMLHAKVAVVDGWWATVGSSNLDPFSLLLNREANIIAVDAAFATELRASLHDETMRNAEKLEAHVWATRGIKQKLASWLALGLIRISSAIFGVEAE